MKRWQASEWNFETQNMLGGFIFMPYQLALGFSLRLWCTGPAVRIYLGPFKLWFSYLSTRGMEEN